MEQGDGFVSTERAEKMVKEAVERERARIINWLRTHGHIGTHFERGDLERVVNQEGE